MRAGYQVASGTAAVRLDANENPYAPPPEVWPAVFEQLAAHGTNRYPSRALRLAVQEELAGYLGVPEELVVVGNGSDALIQAILTVLGAAAAGAAAGTGEPDARDGGDGWDAGTAGDSEDGWDARDDRGGAAAQVPAPVCRPLALIPSPTFGYYEAACEAFAIPCRKVALGRDFALDLPALLEQVAAAGAVARPVLIFLCRPNNPTGTLWPREVVERLLEAGAWVVVDEAYAEFAGETLLDARRPRGDQAWPPRLVVLRTLSKAFGLAGLRIGCAVAAPAVARSLRAAMQPYPVDVFALLASRAMLQRVDWMRGCVQSILSERERLAACLAAEPGLEVVPSAANFLLFRVQSSVRGESAAELCARLATAGIGVRHFPWEPSLNDALRVTVGRPEENDAFLRALACR